MTIEYWLWLSSVTEAGPRAKQALLDTFGSPEKAFRSPPGHFHEIRGIPKSAALALEERNMNRVREIMQSCRDENIDILTPDDWRYPDRLKNIYAPPCALYVRGRLPDVDRIPAVAVIGTRRASPYGKKMGNRIAEEIDRCGGIVISGLTAGVDAAAAEGALKSGNCIAVLGTPHGSSGGELADQCAKNGAVVTEYPPGAEQQRSFFRDRNRIASGLSVGVVVVESPARSGTRLFAREAAEQGRDVFAVPGNADSPGSVGITELIRDGAKPVMSGWDILSEYVHLFPNLHENPNNQPDNEKNEIAEKGLPSQFREKLEKLSTEQLTIVSAIDKNGSFIDEIIAATGCSTSRILSQLTILEIKGIIRRETGKRILLNTDKLTK